MTSSFLTYIAITMIGITLSITRKVCSNIKCFNEITHKKYKIHSQVSPLFLFDWKFCTSSKQKFIFCFLVWFQVILSCCLIVDGVLCGVLMKNEFYWINIAAVAIGGGLLSAGVALFNYIASKDLDNPCKLVSIIIIGGVTGGFWLTAVCVLSVAIKR